MKELMTRFWNEEEGFGTVELVILLGVLVAIALVFRNSLTKFVKDLMDNVFSTSTKTVDDTQNMMSGGGGDGGGGGG